MTVTELCNAYLAGLDAGDLDAVLALFAPGAEVVSPLYGTMPARDFYAALFADTEASDTTLLNIFDSSDNGGAVALHFRYGWTLADGTPVAFEVVDVIELTRARDAFAKLTIIYDTAPLRSDWATVHNG
ncbi:MAG: nuclear transport factor 2 family protein [Maritimibacter sp.]|nr:nuclear transport factor 2 family protein [Maritimibacter sp.]